MTLPLWSSFRAATRLSVLVDLLSAARARCSSKPFDLDLTGSQRRQLKRLLRDRDHQLQMGARQLAGNDDTIQSLVRLLKAEASAKKRLLSKKNNMAADLLRQQQQLEHSDSCIAEQLRQLALKTSSIDNQQTQLRHKASCIAAQQANIESLTAELSSSQQLLSEKDAQAANQQAELAAEQEKVEKVKNMFFTRQAAEIAAKAERDTALAERDAATAKAAATKGLLGRAATRLSRLEANLEVERQRALTAQQSSADSATYTQALLNELAAKDAELSAAKSRLYAIAEANTGTVDLQGQVQLERLPCEQQTASSHSNPLFTHPLSPPHAFLPAFYGPQDAAVASTPIQQVCHGLSAACIM